MHSMSESLANLLAFLNSDAARDSTKLAALREDLNRRVGEGRDSADSRSVQRAMGLVAMDMASGRRSQTNVTVASPRFNLSMSRGTH